MPPDQMDKAYGMKSGSNCTSFSSYRAPVRENDNRVTSQRTNPPDRTKFSSPKFSAIPHNRVVEEGETARFECTVVGRPSPTTSWDRYNVAVVCSSDPRVTVCEQDDAKILEISNVTVNDEGLYRVLVENEYGYAEATARLDVINHRRKQHENGETNRAYEKHYARHTIGKVANVGGNCAISCNVPDELSYCGGSATWYKNGETLKISSSILSKNCDTAFQLHFNNLTLEDSGVYTCILENDFSKTRCSAELIILNDYNHNSMNLQPPVFVTGLPQKSRVVEGEQLEFRVKLKGVSPMRVTWFKNDKSLPNNKDFQYINNGRGEYGLRLKEAYEVDSGLYRCEAYNHHGDAQTVGHLLVEEPPSIELIENYNNADKDENRVGRNKTKKIYGDSSKNDSEDSAVFLSDIYSATAIFTHDDHTTPATVIEGPADETILLDESVSLIVRYFGHPEPKVTWKKAGRLLEADARITVTTCSGESILHIERVTADDGGKYVVEVENDCGMDTHTTSVAVEGPPDTPNGRPSSVAGDRSATVTWCSPPYDGGRKVTGYTIEMRSYSNAQWRKVVENCHSLTYTMRGLNPGESYIFRIRAENAHGLSAPSMESAPTYITHADVCSPVEQKRVNIQAGIIFTQQYEILEELGKGRYGVVHKIRDKEFRSNSFYAAKIIRCIKAKDKEKVREEVAIMNFLKHPKLLQLITAFENSKEIIVVTEYISGGELFERVVADDFSLTERDCILFMRQICEGVAYIHKNNVVHLDLKPENIMCVSRMSHQIKIIDFGLSQKISVDTPVRVLFGTPEFIPPEIINYEPIGTESDMWSVGVICYVLLSGLSPFMGENDPETFANITRADYDFDDDAFDAISEDGKDFISSLLIKRKEKRLTAKQCLHHEWLAQHDKTMSCVKLCTDKLKRFIIRRKWQKTGSAIAALRRMATLSAASRRSSSANSSASSSPRASLCGTYSSRMLRLDEDDGHLLALPIANGHADEVETKVSSLNDSLDCNERQFRLEVPTRNSHRKTVAFEETTSSKQMATEEDTASRLTPHSTKARPLGLVESSCNLDSVESKDAPMKVWKEKSHSERLEPRTYCEEGRLSLATTTDTTAGVSNLRSDDNLNRTNLQVDNEDWKLNNRNLRNSTSISSMLNYYSGLQGGNRDHLDLNRKNLPIGTIQSVLKTSKDSSPNRTLKGDQVTSGTDVAATASSRPTAQRLKNFEQISSRSSCTSKMNKETRVCSSNNFQKAVAFWNRG